MHTDDAYSPPEYSPALLDILWDKNTRRAFVALARLFVETDHVERALIREEWDFGREWSMPRIRQIDVDHAVFGPVDGVDEDGNQAEALLTAILIFLVLRGPEDDRDEDIAHIGLIYHCALEAGVDPDLLFGRVAQVAGEPIGTYLTDFLRRTPFDRSLWSMGYRKRRVGVDVEFEWFGNDKDFDAAKPDRLDSYGAEIEIS